MRRLVTLSNIKLNNDIYSTRSLSILRRVLVKNLLTLLYDTNPLLDYWFDDAYQNEGVGVGSGASSGQCGARGHEGSAPEPLLGEDEQNGWIEQTLNAAGLNDDDDDDELADPHQHHLKMKDERTAGINNNNNSNNTGNKVSTQPFPCPQTQTNAQRKYKCDQNGD
ncbi:hypothetical protein BGZ59_001025 [Podila verticillata]|nr:hypothetical protein BGZ59_001025 [Podila verticillata]